MRLLGIMALGLLLAAASTTHARDCKNISDPVARLACFDAASKAPAVKKISLPKIDEFAAAKAAMAKKLTPRS
jgi:hypothetical protein